MIEISHRQARRLIRQGLDDRPLPEEQWTVLQAHLECCQACRAYAGRLAGGERDLTRTLQDRWNHQSVPAGPAVSVEVAAARRERIARRRIALRVLYGVGLVAAVIAISTILQYRQVAQRAAPAAGPAALSPAAQAAGTQPAGMLATATSAPTPEPSLSGPAFRGLLAYAAVQDGNSEIFLLNRAGPVGAGSAEITNLTQNPAQDVSPVWSPDGEWIAFLSDRDSAGRFELYAMTVAGTRLTRLTARQDVQWTGPLTWSASGETIALIGRRSTASSGAAGQSGEPFIFFVPVAGEDEGGIGPRTLGFTRGVVGPLRFSPAAGLLAYVEPRPGGLLIYDLVSSTFSGIPALPASVGAPLTADGDFDWSPDGRQIAFLTYESSTEDGTGPLVQRLRLSGDLFTGIQMHDEVREIPALASEAPGEMRQVTWLPSRSRRVLAYLGRSGGDAATPGDCWTLRLIQVDVFGTDGAAAGAGREPREVQGLCIASPLGPASWSEEGEWLVVSARRPEETQAGIFAIHIPRDLALLHPAAFDRIPAPESAVLVEAAVLVRPSPEQAVLSRPINPRVVEDEEPLAAPLAAPAAPEVLPGRLLANIVTPSEGKTSLRGIAEPLGPGAVLLSTVGAVTCPAGEQDGERLAFLSDMEGELHGGNELFVAKPNGSEMVRLTDRSEERRPLQVSWGCPVWSPDGTRVALSAQDGVQRLLLILPVDGSEGARVEVNMLLTNSPPVWSPDGRGIVLAQLARSEGPLRIVMIDVTASPPVKTVLYESDEFHTVLGMSFSPPAVSGRDAPRIAFIAARYNASGSADLRLYSMHTNGSGLELLAALPVMEFRGWMGTPSLIWLPGRGIFYTVPHRTDARAKTSLWEYDTTGRQSRALAFVEDMIYSTAWSPDRRWLAYNSDSGLYLIDMQSARQGEAAPMLVSSERVVEIDWH